MFWRYSVSLIMEYDNSLLVYVQTKQTYIFLIEKNQYHRKYFKVDLQTIF